MLLVTKLKELALVLSNVFKRFNIAFILAIISSILACVSSHLNYQNPAPHPFKIYAIRLTLTSIIATVLFLVVALLLERIIKKGHLFLIIIYSSAISLTCLYYFFFSNYNEYAISIKFFVILISLALMFLITPYFFKKPGFEIYIKKLLPNFVITIIVYIAIFSFISLTLLIVSNILEFLSLAICFSLALASLSIPYFFLKLKDEQYTKNEAFRIIISLVFSVIVFIGILAILFTANALLGFRATSYIFIDVAIVSLLVTFIYFIGKLPDFEQVESEFNIVLKTLFLNILLPILSIYTAILYLYFIKILILFKWPDGLVGNLTIWYGLFTAFIIFITKPLSKDKWIQLFNFWMPKVILPLLLMMFASLSIRISNYGITEIRYYVFLIGIILFLVMTYWNFSKERNNVLVLSLVSIVLILSLVGPWSSFSVSMKDQNNRLEKIVKKYDLFENDKFNIEKLSSEDRDIAISVIMYFHEKHSISEAKSIPKDFKYNSGYGHILGKR